MAPHPYTTQSPYRNEAQDDAQASISFTSVPMSFSFSIVFLIEVLLIASLAVLGYFALNHQVQQLEKSFSERGQAMASTVAAAATAGYPQKNFESLTVHFSRLVQPDDIAPSKRAIHEIFVLSKNGKILSHSDFTRVPGKKSSALAQVEQKYNKEAFHAPLRMSEGNTFRHRYPYAIDDAENRATFFIKSLLPDNINQATDFAAPIYYKGKAVATAHVVMTRQFMHGFLRETFFDYVLVCGVALLAGLIVSAICLVAFAIRARHLQRLWQTLFLGRYKGDPQLQERVQELSERVAVIEKNGPQALHEPGEGTGGGETQRQTAKSEQKKVYDAILIE